MKIYTKTGDGGETSLLSGTRVSKADERIEAYGSVDELNSFVGDLKDHLSADSYARATTLLAAIQSNLFLIGSHLADDTDNKYKLPSIDEYSIKELENHMDTMNEALPELKNFILPGGDIRSSKAQICRTICRRAERRIVLLDSKRGAPFIQYLNRLSDYFFVLARYILLKEGKEEIKWRS